MVSQLKVNEIIKQSGSSITIGVDGDTVSGPFTNVPAFFAYASADQTVSDATNTVIQINKTLKDTNTGFNTSTYRYVVPVAGTYCFYGTARLESSTAGDVGDANLKIRKNGSDVIQIFENYSGNNIKASNPFGSVILQCVVNDYIDMTAYINVGSGTPKIDTNGDSSYRTYLAGYKLIGA